MRPNRAIQNWLSEFKVLSENEIPSYASKIGNDQELRNGLDELFSSELTHEVLDPVCHQLFDFFRSNEAKLRLFCLEYTPTLILIYLTAISCSEKKKCSAIEALLLGMYNLDIVNSDGSPKTHTTTIPTLAMPSIYHEPPSLAALVFTENLYKRHKQEPEKIVSKPLPQYDYLNAQNRCPVLSHVCQMYYEDIGNLSTRSHAALAHMAIKLCKTGFESTSCHLTDTDYCLNLNTSLSSNSSRDSRRASARPADDPRITLTSQLLLEILSSVYFVMFNGLPEEGEKAVDAIHERANYELFSDTLLVTNAIQNSLKYNPSGRPKDGPVGLNTAVSSIAHPSVSKNAITNASFRAKKMPDDIDIRSSEDDPPRYDELVHDSRPPAPADSSKHPTPALVVSASPATAPNGPGSDSEKSKGGTFSNFKSIMKRSDKSKPSPRHDSDRSKRDAISSETSPRHVIPTSVTMNAVDDMTSETDTATLHSGDGTDHKRTQSYSGVTDGSEYGSLAGVTQEQINLRSITLNNLQLSSSKTDSESDGSIINTSL